MPETTTEFFHGAMESIEAVELRLDIIFSELIAKGKHDPMDVFFDVKNAVKEVKENLTIM